MRTLAIAVAALLSLGVSGRAFAQAVPGNTVEERAVTGAKAYLQKNNLKGAELNMLLNSLFRNAMPDFASEWKELTGVEIISEPLGYTDIPSKIMGECVAKTGAFDIFNDFPYTQPDAAGCGVLQPLDEYAEQGQAGLLRHARGVPRPAAVQWQAVQLRARRRPHHAGSQEGPRRERAGARRVPGGDSARSSAVPRPWPTGRSRPLSSTPKPARPAGASPSKSRFTAPWGTVRSTSHTVISRPISARSCSTRR